MKIDKIVLATTNKGKLAELGKLLQVHGIETVGLEAFPDVPEVAETGATFTENALLKARAVSAATGLVAIADDSGLMVDALDGAPGVFSARYGDDWDKKANESRDQRNMRKLLHFMRNIPPERRGCHFETAIAAVAPNGREYTATGQWHGRLLSGPLGQNGFGYDPIFFDETLQKSAAQLTQAEKNAVSHRGKALKALMAGWPEFSKQVERD